MLQRLNCTNVQISFTYSFKILTVVLDSNMAVVFHIQQDRDNEGVHPRESPPNAYTDCVH